MLGLCAKSHSERRVIRCLLSKNVPTRGLSRFLSEEAIRWLIFFFLLFKNLISADGCRSSTKPSELFMTLSVPSATLSLITVSFMEELLPISAVQ